VIKNNNLKGDTLEESMMKLKKKELLRVGDFLNLKLPVHWTKGKMVSAIRNIYLEKPEEVVKVLSKSTLDFISRIYEGGHIGYTFSPTPQMTDIDIEAEESLLELADMGVVTYCGGSDKVSALVSREFGEAIYRCLKRPKIQELIVKYDRDERVLLGILYYYGILKEEEFYRIFSKVSRDISLEEFKKFIQRRYMLWLSMPKILSEDTQEIFYIFDEVQNPTYIFSEIRREIDYKICDEETYYRLGDLENCKEKIQGRVELEESLFEVTRDRKKSENIVYDIIMDLRNDLSPNNVLRGVFEDLRFENQSQIEKFVPIFTEFANNTPLWILKGNSPKDVYKRVSSPSRKSSKVGRNDPCPCGSGKKYKKCCGKL